MRIIGAICLYNEEDNVYHGLEEIHKIADLDCVHILEGAWKNGGSSPNSTDRTLEEIARYCNDHPLAKVYLDSNPHEGEYFESQSAKRNYQLYLIEQKLAPQKGEEYYIFVFDADESIRFADGREQIHLKEFVSGRCAQGLCASVQAYAKGSTENMETLRFIPRKRGVHYYTGQSMVLHDKEHTLIMDYDPRHFWTEDRSVSYFHGFFIVNDWARKGSRLLEKIAYAKCRETKRLDGYSEKCTWSPT